MVWRGKSILIVEDDEQMLEILQEFCQGYGAQVLIAGNGKEAIEVLSQHPIDLVVSDIQMPVMGGEALLSKIVAGPPPLPIVLFLTGQANLTEEKAIAKGAAGILFKPFHIRTFVERVNSLLKIAG